MPLLHHPDNMPCAMRAAIVPACRFLPHNDGTPNPIGAWDAWVAACTPTDTADPTGTTTGATMHLCRGLWAFTEPLVIPNGYFLILEGAGQEVSRLTVTGTPGSSGLMVVGFAAGRIQGISLETTGDLGHGLMLSAGAAVLDRVHLVDVQVITESASGAAVTLINSGQSIHGGDMVLDRCRILNYSPKQPSPALRIVDWGGLHVTGHTEIHNYSPGAEVIALHNMSRLALNSGLVGSNANVTDQTPPQYRAPGHAYISISGSVTGIGAFGTLFFSDNGVPPTYGFYQEPGSYLDGVDIGWASSMAFSSGLIGGERNIGNHVFVSAMGVVP